jgi:pimeloyl-ACP methyl ester carboxylesterase
LQWQVALNISGVMNSLIDQRRIGPMVLVMPATYSGKTFTECLDSSRGLDDTYLTDDVRAEVVRQFRVSDDSGQWGIGGFSSGGYCAANLALRHPANWGAVASLSGYYSPAQELAGVIIGHDPALLSVNDPDQLAAHIAPGTGPLPAFWVSTGTDRGDEADAKKFVHLMTRLEPVQLVVQPNSGHQFYAWYYALPAALTWLWPQITTPDMRAMFPLTGSTVPASIPGYKPPTAHPVATPPPLPTVTVTRTETVPAVSPTSTRVASSGTRPPSPTRTPTPTKSSRP